MTATSSLPVAIPLRALLPDDPAHTSSSPPTTLLPPLSAVLGPLPPTSPIHLALDFLESSELDEFDSSSDNGGNQVVRRGETVLVVTGPKASWGQEIEAEDEDDLRDKGGRYGTLRHLRKIQTRYWITSRRAARKQELTRKGIGRVLLSITSSCS